MLYHRSVENAAKIRDGGSRDQRYESAPVARAKPLESIDGDIVEG